MVIALGLKVDGWNSFTLRELQLWIERNTGGQTVAGIGMTDKQFHWYTHLCGKIKNTINDIPIIFLDAPMPSI